MADIVISYAREDEAIALELARLIQGFGLSVWWDRSLVAGENFYAAIDAEIARAKRVIVLWSHDSVSSRWVLSEAEEASQQQKLLPILVNDVKIPLGFRTYHSIELNDARGRMREILASLNLLEAVAATPEPASAAARVATTAAPLPDESDPDFVSKVFAHIPEPAADGAGPFLMPVEDVFSIKGRGTVVTGSVVRGRLKVHDKVELVGLGATQRTVATGIEAFRKLIDEALVGDNIGVLLSAIEHEQVRRGQVLAAPGSMRSHSRFTAEVYLLTPAQGGRDLTMTSGEQARLYFRSADVLGTLSLTSGDRALESGTRLTVVLDLDTPVALERGLRFALRDSVGTFGIGAVTTLG
jgi:elongation factor Tu